MSDMPSPRQRLYELLADEQLGQLSVEDRAELEALREEYGGVEMNTIGELLVAFDQAGDQSETVPKDFADRLVTKGRVLVSGESGPIGRIDAEPRSSGRWMPLLIAAVIIAGVSIAISVVSVMEKQSAEDAWQQERQTLLTKIESNETIIARSNSALEQLEIELAASEALTEQQREQIVAAREREVGLARQLAAATSRIDEMSETIAMYEEPVDPEILAERRMKLLDVPDTIRVAWQPFDLPDNPAELGDVEGDVVWNDEQQEGYLRFVGLPPNDPNIEQYQVWIIDERGMEQKVSGGVFNVTQAGEVIVPIEPGIDVRRVALFAITIEEPGGTWVPDLSRRAVVAPREG